MSSVPEVNIINNPTTLTAVDSKCIEREKADAKVCQIMEKYLFEKNSKYQFCKEDSDLLYSFIDRGNSLKELATWTLRVNADKQCNLPILKRRLLQCALIEEEAKKERASIILQFFLFLSELFGFSNSQKDCQSFVQSVLLDSGQIHGNLINPSQQTAQNRSHNEEKCPSNLKEKRKKKVRFQAECSKREAKPAPPKTTTLDEREECRNFWNRDYLPVQDTEQLCNCYHVTVHGQNLNHQSQLWSILGGGEPLGEFLGLNDISDSCQESIGRILSSCRVKAILCAIEPSLRRSDFHVDSPSSTFVVKNLKIKIIAYQNSLPCRIKIERIVDCVNSEGKSFKYLLTVTLNKSKNTFDRFGPPNSRIEPSWDFEKAEISQVQ